MDYCCLTQKQPKTIDSIKKNLFSTNRTMNSIKQNYQTKDIVIPKKETIFDGLSNEENHLNYLNFDYNSSNSNDINLIKSKKFSSIINCSNREPEKKSNDKELNEVTAIFDLNEFLNENYLKFSKDCGTNPISIEDSFTIYNPLEEAINGPYLKIPYPRNQENETDHHLESDKKHLVKIVSRDGAILKFWECGECKEEFPHQYALEKHLATHSQIPNKHSCKYCGKTFRQWRILTQHLAIHSIERPYLCEICQKSFNRNSTLISHRKTHCYIKPFQCCWCFKGFHQKGNLKNHIYSHTNARPYRCKYCDKGYNQMSNLVCHTKRNHSEMVPVWACSICEATFPKRNLLRAHEFEMHQLKETIKMSKKKFIPIEPDSLTPIVPKQKRKKSAATTTSTSRTTNIIIPAIQTEELKMAKQKNEIPFAIINFLKGVPLLVRIIDHNSTQSLLRPANDNDFALLPKKSKSVSIPIVASLHQKVNALGEHEFMVTPPPKTCELLKNENISLSYERSSSDDNPMKKIKMEPIEEDADNNPYYTKPKIEPNHTVSSSSDASAAAAISAGPKVLTTKIEETFNWDSDNDVIEVFQNMATGPLLSPQKTVGYYTIFINIINFFLIQFIHFYVNR